MTLDELKELKRNNMRLPRRLRALRDFSTNPRAPQSIVIDLGANLESMLVDAMESSYEAAEMLGRLGTNVNPLILHALLACGDVDGAFTHAILRIADSRGLLSATEGDVYHVFTDGTKSISAAVCGDQKLETTCLLYTSDAADDM
eukprot:3503695-Prymnesium_polylepis.1